MNNHEYFKKTSVDIWRTLNQFNKTNKISMKALLFPGQGSQVKGMGGDLFDKYPEIVTQADAVLGYSIKELCLEDPKEQLGFTAYTQPALYTVSVLAYLDKKQADGFSVDFAAGHSVGEYAALYSAGAFDFETGLKLVQKRGALMNEVEGGGMAAVVGLTEDKIRELLSGAGLDTVDLANFNTPEQIVISGLASDIDKCEPIIKGAGRVLFVRLNVSGAFHSRYMKDSADTYAAYINSFEFKAPASPVVSNVEATSYASTDAVKDLLIKQMYSPVRWVDSIRYIKAQGEIEFEEVGSGNVLTKLLRKI